MDITIPTANTWNTTGNWNKKYLDPNTDAATATKLYNTYGSRYNWMPLTLRLDPNYGKPATPPAETAPTAETPTPAVPTAKTPNVASVANSKEIFPFLTSGAKPQEISIPRYNWDSNSSQNIVNANTANVGNIASYLPKPTAEDPTYKYQLEEGERALKAKLAAQGLSGSGAELEATRRMISDLTSQKAQRDLEIAKADQTNQMNLANSKLDAMSSFGNQSVSRYGNEIQGAHLAANIEADKQTLMQQEAERLRQMQVTEAQRLVDEGETNWKRLQDSLNFLQNANPLGYAQSASDALAKIYESMGTQIPQYMLAMK